MLLYILRLGMVLVLCSSCSLAAINKQVVNDVKKYFTDLNSVAIDFMQVDGRGKKSFGKLLIEKPNKFRCNYYPPYPILIIGNANYISIYDYQMEYLSFIEAKENMLTFLLVGEFDLHPSLIITRAEKIGSKLIIDLYDKGNDYKSSLVLNHHPMALASLELTEPDSNKINIKFTNITKVTKFNKKLFILRNPEVFGSPPHLTKTELESYYKY